MTFDDIYQIKMVKYRSQKSKKLGIQPIQSRKLNLTP